MTGKAERRNFKKAFQTQKYAGQRPCAFHYKYAELWLLLNAAVRSHGGEPFKMGGFKPVKWGVCYTPSRPGRQVQLLVSAVALYYTVVKHQLFEHEAS
ncbi:hypothetical protein DUNSADRAFT_12488 [Dunaliella salina]|uniref:Uncharacterized protein n=1 Tax=Dunaliella salina TaxID=3046 RepID=A0ABQ7GB97_DUNSA|nr:hypothetical protein DUNSADRAFT_12488 [Dunaliella salina]|eukprot:KAF5831864.1 hypothetical protein DUNSADRAFT_12488 [Dunaliella salina]